MMDLIALIAWIAAGCCTGFFAARKFLRHCEEEFGTDGGDYLFAAGIWGITGIFWPITIVALMAAKLLKRDHEKNDPNLREERLRKRERHIRDLERELGIR